MSWFKYLWYCMKAVWAKPENLVTEALPPPPSHVYEYGEPLLPWPPEGAPLAFGNTTAAKPRPGVPDTELANIVKGIIWGNLDLSRERTRAQVIVTYADGRIQPVYEVEGNVRVIVGERCVYFEKPEKVEG